MSEAAQAFVERAHTARVVRAFVVLVLTLGLSTLMYVDYGLRTARWSPAGYLREPEAWGLTTLVLLATGYYLARRLGNRQGVARASTPRGVAQPGDGAELVVCCSGGGIKSGSFCLGGLQRLFEAGVYQSADEVVAVSGGGYAAAAFAATARRLREQSSPSERVPFGLDSPELLQLRQRTNYLFPKGRTRFSLVLNLLVGIVVNLLILTTVVLVVAWFLGHHLAATQTVVASEGSLSASNQWHLTPLDTRAVLVPPLALLGLAVLLGIRSVMVNLPTFLSSKNGPAFYRLLFGGQPKPESVLDDMPVTLVKAAVVVLAFLLVMPWAGVVLHNWSAAPQTLDVGVLTPTFGSAELWKGAAAVIAAIGGLISTNLRAQSSTGSEGTFGRVLATFRKSVAPWLAVTLFVVVLVLVAAAAATWVLTSVVPGTEALFPLFILCLALPLVAWSIGSTTRSTVHGFYREQLAYAYLDHDPAVPGRSVSLASVASRGDRLPALTLVGTANVVASGIVPMGRDGTPFVLGPVVGLPDRNLPGGAQLLPVSDYRYDRQKELSLASAMAISGAAIGPTAGRETRRWGPYRLLLAMGNIRLGVWMRNPFFPQATPRSSRGGGPQRWADEVVALNDALDRPTLFNVVIEALGRMTLHSSYLYVSDGGHYDNLGLVECLRRHPRSIVVLDGTGDAEDQFPVLGDVIATARMDLGVTVDLDPSPLCRGDALYPPASHIVGWATHPTWDEPTQITYVRCVLPAHSSWDLESFKLRNPDFPATIQRFEMFDEFDFEAFRQLGYALVDEAVRSGDVPTPSSTADDGSTG